VSTSSASSTVAQSSSAQPSSGLNHGCSAPSVPIVTEPPMLLHPKHPVTIYRVIVLFAATGLTLRCGAAAMELWGWNPDDPTTVARVMMAKRWIDPIALAFGMAWMGLAILGEPGVEHQLRKAPLPVDMWSRWPALVRAGAVVILSFTAALAAVCLR
jgi:hypothetical protein